MSPDFGKIKRQCVLQKVVSYGAYYQEETLGMVEILKIL